MHVLSLLKGRHDGLQKGFGHKLQLYRTFHQPQDNHAYDGGQRNEHHPAAIITELFEGKEYLHPQRRTSLRTECTEAVGRLQHKSGQCFPQLFYRL